jgi:hypothetical protein
MRTATRTSFLLAATLAVVPGCDEELDAELAPGDEEIEHRCLAGCGPGQIGNTSRIGDHALSNLSKTLGQNATNLASKVRIAGGYGYWGATKMQVTAIDVEADGELRLQLSTAGWISGTAVKNAYFNVIVTPDDASKPAFSGKLLIADVQCAPGELDATMSICKYMFVTNVKPSDTVAYPAVTMAPGYWHTCPSDNDGGQLSWFETYSAVLSPQAALTATSATTPRIDPFPGQFILGCINGAVSKTQYHLNAFYDASAYRGLDPSQPSAALLMWMAWHAGASRTEPGALISPHDPIGGLFTWTAEPTWDVEAGYKAGGAACRGGPVANGLHRKYVDPVQTLANWANLPYCDASAIDGGAAVLGVKVQAP